MTEKILFVFPSSFHIVYGNLFIEEVFMLLLQASHCVTKESISHTEHTCLDHTFMLLMTFKLGGRRMHLVFFLTCGVSASCANKPKWGSSMNSGTVP